VRPRGFTIIELLVVIALIAIAAGAVSLALRDGSATRLERDGARLAALLESARAEARASGLPVRFEIASADAADGARFRFVGLPPSARMPDRWLDSEVSAEIVGARALLLGPEPLLPAQRIVLRLGDQRLVLATDGLAPFAVPSEGAAP
jgi:general secretion pathway protein H